MTSSAETLSLDQYAGQVLRKARLMRRMRQDDLARALGVDRSTITRYELGERSLSLDTLARLATLLRWPIGAFLPQETPELTAVVQTLHQHPEFIPRVVDLLELSLTAEN